ncbi:Non-specific lipid-transfer protein A [Hibiscus syriacus]|uniref:Non-specific lipid-transfer protein n=1 Tax=Hibiscus syriacus TaxID=106335 RepID=A0A6A2XEL4_HIBSY|nr:uncharacterized protein LOC120181724 [Hibiscus syriacus]KAE8665625.1 Non-specific lipid-transfer protein A [Hibiscus syriacus]
MKGATISVFVMLVMFQFMVKQGDATVSCDQVRSSLAKCVPFLTGAQAVPAAGCCSGVLKLRTIATITADKQAACNCVKDAAASMPSIKEDAAASLPAKCNVQFIFPISRNTDCKNIQEQTTVNCDQVRGTLVHCVPFLTGTQAVPTADCCSGVSRLQTIATTTADKQAACNCVKDTAATMPSIKEDAAASLPAKCNVQVSFPISRKTDCKNIQEPATVSCDQVRGTLVHCIPFLTGNQAVPTADCCSSVSRLQTIASTTADKQAACNCVKETAASMPCIKEEAAASLPTKCNVQFNFPISKNTDCST